MTRGVPRAASALTRLDVVSSPLEKILCLKRAVVEITTAQADPASSGSVSAVSSDELIPLLMLTIVRSEVTHWHAHLLFLERFQLSGVYSGDVGYGRPPQERESRGASEWASDVPAPPPPCRCTHRR